MVETRLAETLSLRYTVKEQTLVSKTGNERDCEDAIYAGPYFVAVIDGATSKTGRRWNGETGGRTGAQILREVFDTLPYDATARQAVDACTAAVKQMYEAAEVVEAMQSNPAERIVASFIAVSLWRKEVWCLGDCQCLLNNKRILNAKEVDTIASLARSLFLEAEVTSGKTIEELQQNDTGRAFILPLLTRQMIFQNDPAAGQYWFAVIDGFEVPDEGIHVVDLQKSIKSIVLASDGYPHLKKSLKASEQALREVLEADPLLFRKYKTTKGVYAGNVSYDDRAYIKIKIHGS